MNKTVISHVLAAIIVTALVSGSVAGTIRYGGYFWLGVVRFICTVLAAFMIAIIICAIFTVIQEWFEDHL